MSRDARTGPGVTGRTGRDRRKRPPQSGGLPRGCRRPRARVRAPRGAAIRRRRRAAARGRPRRRRGPAAARLAGVLLVLAAVAGVAALFPTYLVVGGQELSAVRGFGSVLAALLVPVVNLAVGVVLVRGAVPKFGLAYAGVAGALALGQLLIEIYRGSSSTTRPGVEVIAGERVLTSSVDVGAGWVLGVVALALTVLAGVVAVAAWGRTVMEDGGALDPVRSGLAGAAVLLGRRDRPLPGPARRRRARPAGDRPRDRAGDRGDPRGPPGAAGAAGHGAARRAAPRRRGRALLGRRAVAASAPGRRGRPARDRGRRARRRR